LAHAWAVAREPDGGCAGRAVVVVLVEMVAAVIDDWWWWEERSEQPKKNWLPDLATTGPRDPKKKCPLNKLNTHIK